MHPDAERLSSADEALRREAGEMLAQSGIGAILQRAGYQAVGSYHMHTMTWRDLDLERYEEPDWRRHWEVGAQLAETGWCLRLQCIDVYRETWPKAQPDFGLYWGIRMANPDRKKPAPPGDPTVWKLDLWTARAEEFAPARRRRDTWVSLMTEEKRSHILAIKEAVCDAPEYRKSLLSVHIYEGVLEQGIRSTDSFQAWWARKYGEPEVQ